MLTYIVKLNRSGWLRRRRQWAGRGLVMPFADISLVRGKSPEYVHAVSRAVHDALVSGLNMKPEDDFQLIHEFEQGAMVFPREFRGGPRSQDWTVVRITDGLERGPQAKRRFYTTLVRLLKADPGISPADVFVMMTLTPPENFSFADGVIGTDMVAVEALDAAAGNPGSREAYTKGEMVYAITELFEHRDSSRILPMLGEDFVMSLPESLPYGGDYTGRKTFEDFFAKTPGGTDVWDSFSSRVDQVIEAEGHFAVQLTNTAVPKVTGVPVVLHNLWLFEAANGRVVRTRLYADTAQVRG
ncbi:tautomerase family protein [Streptomyces sp. NPDC056672]|uniref:tautomerase family protein n=1 Tax=Streptomyces sp. NPDC056672 TaxID=3345906 RepID=UPI0036BB5994